MITNVMSATQTPAAPAPQASTASPATYHTPFGDVLVDHMSAPDILAEFGGKAAAARAAATPEAAVATADGGVTQASTSNASATGNANATSTANATNAVSRAAASPAPAAAPAAASSSAAANTAPTAQSVFGDNPWMQNPGGTSIYGATWQYNPIYFASDQTAEKVASMVGGTVVQQNAILGDNNVPFRQNSENNMVELPGGGIINPGLVADFYDHGYSQSTINQMIQNEVKGAELLAQNGTQGV